ncbi:hypothetical protein A9179_19775 [Pseudomonas alcaligenes]|uniref:DUF4124 domain-containing protein n=1 Tax=Aquipseudomonas alcaligenes TaxID=43263 RepID=A0ABR7S6Q4_AQUAC|nr:DUF4124 domain-containing protein [Pseudomonas alcaligenes]MBC9252510.1 hypothetical protein [Pseudomonas alcaligenes]
MRLLTACLLCALALPASAEIYKYTDANGNTVFTNQKPEGQSSETVALPPTNTVEAQAPSRVIATPDSPPAAAQSGYSVLQLTNLPSEEALRANNGTFSVGVNIEPRLQPGHLLRLILDGEPYGLPSNVPRLQLSNIDRGDHRLAVEVISGAQRIQLSNTVTFTVQRISTNSPARPKPTPHRAP